MTIPTVEKLHVFSPKGLRLGTCCCNCSLFAEVQFVCRSTVAIAVCLQKYSCRSLQLQFLLFKAVILVDRIAKAWLLMQYMLESLWIKCCSPSGHQALKQTETSADPFNTLHVIITSGGVQMWGFFFGTPQGSRKWDGAIPTHGNGRYGYYKNLVFRSKIEKCKQFSPATSFWTSVEFHPPGQPSRQDETTPRGRFVNFTLRGLLWHLEYWVRLHISGTVTYLTWGH